MENWRCELDLVSLSNLPFPAIVEELDFEEIVKRKLNKVKEILADKGIEYQESEADDLMTLIEMDSYEEIALRASLNERIKQNFLAYATSSNLDHIGATRFGVERLQGKEPVAKYEFSLSLAQDSDVVLPKGLLLGSGEDIAELMEDIVIKTGELSAVGEVKLRAFVKSSEVKLEDILTPIPWVVTATQLTPFENGAEIEDDERYRDRIWLSRERKTTAGSKLQYIFYAKSADVRVQEADVRNGGAGVVEVAILQEGFNTSDELVEIVKTALDKEEIRPLTDSVVVKKAVVKDVTIKATLFAKDISLVDTQRIKDSFSEFEGKFGARLSIAKVYDLLTDSNIVDVSLESPSEVTNCEWDEVIKFSFELGVQDAS